MGSSIADRDKIECRINQLRHNINVDNYLEMFRRN